MVTSLRGLSPEQEALRWRNAGWVRQQYDVPGFPRLAWWNYSPCIQHKRDPGHLVSGCLSCGAEFRRHQRVGVLWLWLIKKGLLADPVGTGKTVIIAGLLAMAKEAGELGEYRPGRRAVIVCQAAAIEQWQRELRRFLRPPSGEAPLMVSAAAGDLRKRSLTYADPWEVMIISPETLRMRKIRRGASTRLAGDLEMVQQFNPGIVVYDDVDAMRHYDNKTAYAVTKLCERAERVVGVHATPLQKRLPELWSFLVPVGGSEVLGPLSLFRQQFVKTRPFTYVSKDRYGHKVERVEVKEVGVEQGPLLKRLVAPLVLRRATDDIDDAAMPALVSRTVWLDPSEAQRARYAELRQGVLRMIKEQGEQVSRDVGQAVFLRGWQICSSLATLDDASGESPASVKLDWVCDKLDGDMVDDKAVVFLGFRPSVEDLSRRLEGLGIGHVIMWSQDPNRKVREERLARFRDDPECRVLLGTTTIERSLNLQVARHLIAVDTLLNPARMTQIAGRVRRDGSPHRVVYYHQLLLRGTQEAHYPVLLSREQAVADYVWGDSPTEMFPSLSPLQLLQLISGDPELLAAAGR